MGLIKSFLSATSGTLADQWVDFYTCDSMSNDVLMKEGTKPLQSRSGNRKGSENIISNGSKINVADGQCMLICENGKIVDFCAEPGQYIYDNKIQPSLLGGGFKDLGATFAQIGKRFAAGGTPTDQQRIYYVNTKEIIGNKIGWGKIPFRDGEFRITVKVQGFGQYSFKIVNPLLFYTNIAANIVGEYTREQLTSQMKSEVIASLQPALRKIGDKNVPYDELTRYPLEIGKALDEEMDDKWGDLRGIEVVSLAMESLTVDDASAKKIEELQEARAYSDTALAGGRMVGAKATAMVDAANNPGGMGGIMGMGMVNAFGGSDAEKLFSMSQQQNQTPTSNAQPTPQISADTWICACGTANSKAFCAECGSPKPVAAALNSWTCTCGAVCTGKFCPECGNKKIDAPKCGNCGWTAPDGQPKPKFCTECGTKME